MIPGDELRRLLADHTRYCHNELAPDERDWLLVECADAFPALARECLAWRAAHPEAIKAIEEASHET